MKTAIPRGHAPVHQAVPSETGSCEETGEESQAHLWKQELEDRLARVAAWVSSQPLPPPLPPAYGLQSSTIHRVPFMPAPPSNCLARLRSGTRCGSSQLSSEVGSPPGWAALEMPPIRVVHPLGRRPPRRPGSVQMLA